MFYKSSNKQSLIKIGDYFATLKNITSSNAGTNVKFEFQYSISQVLALRYDAYSVKVIVHTQKIKKEPMFVSKGTSIDAEKAVNDILTSVTSAKNLIAKNADSEIVSVKSDITAKIDNQMIGKIQTAIATGDKSILPNKPKLKVVPAKSLKQSNENKIMLEKFSISEEEQSAKSPVALKVNVKKINYDLIVNKGIDPASMTSNIASKFSNSYQTSQSLSLKPPKHLETVEEANLDNHVFYKLNQKKVAKNVFDLEDDELVTVVSTEKDDMTDVPVEVSFTFDPKKNYTVEFLLTNRKTGESIDTVSKSLNVYSHINNFLTPTKAPKIKVINAIGAKIPSLEITQVDPFANKVLVYSKVINTDIPKSDYYSLYETFDLPAGQTVNVSVNNTSTNQIFRAIPARDNIIGTIFSSTVLKPDKPSKMKPLAITSRNVIEGIDIEVSNIPDAVIAVQIMRKNLSLFEKVHKPISTFKTLNPENILSTQQTTFKFTDKYVFDSHVYEYAAKLEYLGGSVIIAGSEIIEHVAETPGKVDVRIENIQINENQNDVTFNVNMLVKDEDIQNIKKSLEQQGFDSYFDSDLSKQREQVKNLLAFSVERVNLKNGDRENLGIHTETLFTDSQASKKYNAKSLEMGVNYRYSVKALLREPETLVKNFKKVVVNPINKKKYSFSPYISNHPITLKKGTIVTAQSLKTHYSKSDLEHGEIGCTTHAEISMPAKKSYISAVTISRFDKDKILINCIVVGSLNQIDHIIISKKSGSSVYVRVGATHSSFAGNTCQYVHHVSKEVGNITFSAIPVYNDYTLGNSVNSNSILVQLWQNHTKVQMALQYQIQR